MSISLGLLAFLSGGTALFLLYVLAKIVRGVLTALRPATPHIEVVSPDQAPPPPSPQLESELGSLGLHPLGVTWYESGIIKAHTWYYADANSEIIAEMIVSQSKQFDALVVFTTWFQDQAYLWTSYPSGEHVETENLQVHYSAHSLEAAYAHHKQQVAAWSLLHGDPIQRPRLDQDLDYYHRLYMEKYYRRHMRQRLIRSALIAFVLVLMLLVNVALLLVLELFRFQSFTATFAGTTVSESQLAASSGMFTAALPYLLHWVIGVVALNRLSTWKAPSIEDMQPSK